MMFQNAFYRLGVAIKLASTEDKLSDEDFREENVRNFLKNLRLAKNNVKLWFIGLDLVQQGNGASSFLKINAFQF